jgi:hypothetical protein
MAFLFFTMGFALLHPWLSQVRPSAFFLSAPLAKGFCYFLPPKSKKENMSKNSSDGLQ